MVMNQRPTNSNIVAGPLVLHLVEQQDIPDNEFTTVIAVANRLVGEWDTVVIADGKCTPKSLVSGRY